MALPLRTSFEHIANTLAKHYSMEVWKSEEMRAHQNCQPTVRGGGVLTQATVLAVTSNPSRTSPVKRGLFILDNILGSPPPPPPPPQHTAVGNGGNRCPGSRGTVRKRCRNAIAANRCAQLAHAE